MSAHPRGWAVIEGDDDRPVTWVRIGPGGWPEACQEHVASHYFDEQGKLVKVARRVTIAPKGGREWAGWDDHLVRPWSV